MRGAAAGDAPSRARTATHCHHTASCSSEPWTTRAAASAPVAAETGENASLAPTRPSRAALAMLRGAGTRKASSGSASDEPRTVWGGVRARRVRCGLQGLAVHGARRHKVHPHVTPVARASRVSACRLQCAAPRDSCHQWRFFHSPRQSSSTTARPRSTRRARSSTAQTRPTPLRSRDGSPCACRTARASRPCHSAAQ